MSYLLDNKLSKSAAVLRHQHVSMQRMLSSCNLGVELTAVIAKSNHGSVKCAPNMTNRIHWITCISTQE